MNPRWTPLSRFYARRAWRIAPLFYLTYLLAVLLRGDRSGFGLAWHLSFLSNFYFIREGRFVGACGHLWFIAVLQQFTLFGRSQSRSCRAGVSPRLHSDWCSWACWRVPWPPGWAGQR